MLIETLLRYFAAHVTKRYLAFETYSHPCPPHPTENSRYLLYIHIPFCEQLCPYCCFLRVKMEPSLAAAYFHALKKEIEIYHNLGYCFDSLYVGGGTHTILPDKLAEIISYAKSIWPITQISVETNPNHLDSNTLQILKQTGTNRLSVGVQSFDNKILESIQRLERYGSGEKIKETLTSIEGMFDTLNVDMIFNFPNQTEEMLARDIEIIKKINPSQVTFYPLIVSNNTKKQLAQTCGKVSYRQEKQFYKIIVEQFADTYSQQSAWCFSKNNAMIDEYIVDHDQYAGAGPGSWGYIDGTMYSNTFSIQQYIDMLQKNQHPIVAVRKFSSLERARYDFLLKLLYGSLSLSYMKRKYGRRFRLYLWKELLFFLAAHAVAIRNNNIVLTPKGRYYWVVLMRTLFSVVGDYRNIRISSDAAPSAQ